MSPPQNPLAARKWPRAAEGRERRLVQSQSVCWFARFFQRRHAAERAERSRIVPNGSGGERYAGVFCFSLLRKVRRWFAFFFALFLPPTQSPEVARVFLFLLFRRPLIAQSVQAASSNPWQQRSMHALLGSKPHRAQWNLLPSKYA